MDKEHASNKNATDSRASPVNPGAKLRPGYTPELDRLNGFQFGSQIQNLPSEIAWDNVENEAASLLSRYIQFDTTNPPGNEAVAIEFLADLLRQRGFEPKIIRSAPGRANLITRLAGPAKPVAPPCLLYAHADVVPAVSTDWSVPPFGGQIRDGFVWGRGALDDKGLGIIFLQALTLLKQVSAPLNRDVILLIAADEEMGGRHGVAWLLDNHPELIRAEYVWDEGGMGVRRANGHYLYNIAVAEKGPLTVRLIARGTPGHAALPQSNNSQDRLVTALARIKRWTRPPRLTKAVIAMLKALASEQRFPQSLLFAKANLGVVWPFLRPLLESNPMFAPLIRNTINLTMLKGGETSNVIPAQAEAKLDIRLLPGEDPDVVLADLRSIISDPNVSVVPEEMPTPHVSMSKDSEFYHALAYTLQAMAPPGTIVPYLTPGATDSRFFRRARMQAYGFMPMLLDSQELNRIHGIDERVSLANLRWGIQFVVAALSKLGNAVSKLSSQ